MPSAEAFLPPIIGHRGACGHAPENTIASLRAAADLGLTWVEFDVKLTQDDQIVMLHDDRLERTTTGTGPVAERSLADLHGLDAGSHFSAAFQGEAIPTLDEGISALAELNLGAVVEIKPTPGREAESGRRIAAHLAAHWPDSLPPPLLCSFRPAALTGARETAPQLARALLVYPVGSDWRQRADQVGAGAIHCGHHHLSEDRARQVLQAGYDLRCYTVNDGAQAATLFAWGVQGVITDYPDRMPAV